MVCFIGEQERANLVACTGGIFYIQYCSEVTYNTRVARDSTHEIAILTSNPPRRKLGSAAMPILPVLQELVSVKYPGREVILQEDRLCLPVMLP